MDLVIFEKNKPFIVQSFRDGEFDYMEAASEVFEADFFRFIKARALDELAATIPNHGRKRMCHSGFTSPAPPYGCTACTLSMRFPWWCAGGCSRL